MVIGSKDQVKSKVLIPGLHVTSVRVVGLGMTERATGRRGIFEMADERWSSEMSASVGRVAEKQRSREVRERSRCLVLGQLRSISPTTQAVYVDEWVL
ncbi:hypothetical protein IMZ48_24455 [Candidatus Bathyarchaeota archaeon]|nr:hypothetical protein [Candidatus Bathyarchaeota archaeon]